MNTIDFLPINIELIYKGLKTSTLRTEAQYLKIGIYEGESLFVDIKDKKFKITNKGLKSVLDLGGAANVWKTEGFDYTQGPKFPTTHKFLDNKMKLYYYSIEEVEGDIKCN